MATPLPVTVLTPGKLVEVPLKQGPIATQAIKFSNGSPYDCTVSGFGAKPPGTIIPQGTEVFLYAKEENQGKISILPVDNYNVGGTSIVNMVIYDENESIPRGYWPVTIPVQTVRATVSSVSQLSNENNAPGTLVIDIGPSPAGLNAIMEVWNDHFKWSVDQGGTAHTVLQGQSVGNPLLIGQSGDNSEVLGNLLVDGTETVTGDVTLNGSGTGLAVTNNTTVGGTLVVTSDATFNGADPSITNKNGINTPTPGNNILESNGVLLLSTDVNNKNLTLNGPNVGGGGQVVFQVGGVAQAFIDASSALHINKVNFTTGSFTNVARFTGTGNGTVATGVTNPFSIVNDACTVSGSSQTIGMTVATSSVVTTGAGLAWHGTAYN